MHWFNEPRLWNTKGDQLTFTTEEKTDFWQETHYGWCNDNGHAYLDDVSGDFTAEGIFRAEYTAQYDQAGLMLRFSDKFWLKAGIEYSHNNCTLSTVLTRGNSDWAIGPSVSISDSIHLRLTRRGASVCVQWKLANSSGPFQMLRLGAIPDDLKTSVGPMACSPTRAGLVAHFKEFKISDAIDFANEV